MADFISCNFKGLYANQNILSCPICNEGNLSFLSALNKSIENKHENNRQQIQKKDAKYKNNVEKYCPSCKKWFCSECKKFYHMRNTFQNIFYLILTTLMFFVLKIKIFFSIIFVLIVIKKF